MGSLRFIANVSRLFLSVCVSWSPLGFESRVGCADGGAVAAFDDEGGAQVRVGRVFAADFCDLFGSQVALGEHPQGDRAGHLGHVHAVCVGELARGFDPRAHDAAAVVLLVVLVVAIGEVVSINGERLLFALNPRVDLLLGECDADGGERLAPVAGGGEGAGGDVCVGGADGGGHGFALVEEDERHACDGARVVGVGVEVCALDDTAVCVCAHDAPVVCARIFARVAVCEGDGEAGAVAQGDDVAVVAFHVAAVEELVEGGGELVCVAGGVLCGACWSKAVFDVVPRVHAFVFLSGVSCLFAFAPMWLRVFFARFPARHDTMGVTAA